MMNERAVYRWLSVYNDLRAASRGPGALARRLVRKQVYKAEGQLTRKLFKKLGL